MPTALCPTSWSGHLGPMTSMWNSSSACCLSPASLGDPLVSSLRSLFLFSRQIRSMGATVECPHAPWRWLLLSSHPAGEETDSKHQRNLARHAQFASTQASQGLMLPCRRGPGGGPKHRTCDRGLREKTFISWALGHSVTQNSQLPALVLSASWAGSINPLSK